MSSKHIRKNNKTHILNIVGRVLLRWAIKQPYNLLFFLHITWRVRQANYRRRRIQGQLGCPIPSVVAISPTMRCNYNCVGCYSRGRPTENEFSREELDTLFTQAEEMGVPTIVLTGGEPLLREDIPNLIRDHKKLFFILITNGSLVTPELALTIANSGNVVPLVSIEGPSQCTDERRNSGAYNTAIRALTYFQQARACFGFAATVIRINQEHVVTEVFLDQMINMGCSLGVFIEYVPCGTNPKLNWLMDEAMRDDLRQQVLEFRRRKPIILLQFPHDEYGVENHCKAAGQTFLHINAQGDVEPCPFVSLSRENIRGKGLITACQSTFMRDIRERPYLLQRQHLACSLFEHGDELARLVQKRTTDSNIGTNCPENCRRCTS